MEKILICPGERAAVGFLAHKVPLVTVPLLGETLVTHWIQHLAGQGVRSILLLATDRPELVRSVVGDGSRWGVRVEVRSELKELTPEAACSAARDGGKILDPSRDVVVLDHLPGLEGSSLFRSYRDWFGGVVGWMASGAPSKRIGLHEVQPQIWCGRRTRISPGAKLLGPCWLGDHVQVAPEAIIGPNAVLEDRVVVESASEIRTSLVGPDTFVGSLTRVEDSLAWGNTLINWRSGSCTEVPDPFLLCALSQRSQADRDLEPGVFWQALSALLLRPWNALAGLRRRLRQP